MKLIRTEDLDLPDREVLVTEGVPPRCALGEVAVARDAKHPVGELHLGELHFNVLGPLRGTRGTTGLSLGPARQQAVLTALLFRSGEAVTAPEIIDDVWGEEVPASGVGAVRVYLSRLRGILGSDMISRSVGGYKLRLDRERTDLRVFEKIAADADERSRTGDLEGSALAWRQGLALWRGMPLAGVTGPFAELRRQTLTELRLDSLEMYWNIELKLGRYHGIVPELVVAVRDHPFHERFVALLMLALYHCGRRADALAVFNRTHETLADELNISPSAELQYLRSRILDASDELREDDRRASQPGATTPWLPPPPTHERSVRFCWA